MPPKPSLFLRQLRRSLRQAQGADNPLLVAELQQVLVTWQQPWVHAFPQFTRLLQRATSHITKHYIAEAFGAAQDPRVVPVLIRAAKQPENSEYNAPYFWACEHYDCSAYLPFFVRFLLQSQDPGEAMVACAAVIEAMKGPFAPPLVKRAITKLLQGRRPAIVAELQVQHEVFMTQAACALLDTYLDQVNEAWKTEAGVTWTFYEGLNRKREVQHDDQSQEHVRHKSEQQPKS